MGTNKATKGLPKRVGRKTRVPKRQRHLAKLPERKLRRMVQQNGLRAAWEWADARSALATLRKVLKGEEWADERIDAAFVRMAKGEAA